MSPRSPHAPRTRSAPIYLLVVGVWLCLLAGGIALVAAVDLRDARQRFHEYTDTQFEYLSDRVLIGESVAEGFAAMLGAMGTLDRDKASAYARQMISLYPHIYMFEVAEVVPRERLERFEQFQRTALRPDFEVRAFDFEGDRGWHPAGDKPHYLPIVFMEPMPAGSRSVLGLDVDSNTAFRRSIQESVRLGKPVATEPFRLIEGDTAYFLHRSVAPVRTEPEPTDGALAREGRYGLLLVRAETLLAPAEPPAGLRALVHHRAYGCEDARGHLVQIGRAPPASLADSLLPRLSVSREVDSESQPFVLEVTWQLGWGDLSWDRMAGVLFTAALTFWIVMVYARAYHRHEIARLAEADHLFDLANYDSLTGLANRNLLLDRLGHALARARREGHPLVVLFLDLDGFKKVNDTLGHRVGDRLLQLAAERLRTSLREADTLARRSGDEFLAILEHLSGGTALGVVTGKIRAAFSIPFEVDGRSVALGISVGAARYPEDAQTTDGLLEFADAAMYRDKRRSSGASKNGSPAPSQRAEPGAGRGSATVAARPGTPAGSTAAAWPAAAAVPAGRAR